MDIDRIPIINRHTFRRYIRAGQPFIMPGFAYEWPCYRRWTPDFIAQVCGDRKLPVSYYSGGTAYESDVELTFGELLAKLRSDPDAPQQYYLESAYLPDLSPELCQDLAPPDYMTGLPDMADQVFFGRGAGSCCHIHPHAEAIVFQLLGSKVFHLYHPDDVKNLYFEPLYRDYRRSQIDFTNIDYRRFPRAKRLRRIDLTLEHGDALYLPVHWPHWTEGIEINMTVTRFFAARLWEYRFPSPGIRCVVGKVLQKVLRTS